MLTSPHKAPPAAPPLSLLRRRSAPHAALSKRSLAARCTPKPAAQPVEAEEVIGGATVASQFPQLGVKGKAETAARTAADEFAVLRQLGQIRWTEAVSGLAYVLLMSEALRFVVEGAASAAGAPLQFGYWPHPSLPSAAELPGRLLALSLVALSIDFSQRAVLQLRGASAALASAAAPASQLRRFQLAVAGKVLAELAGLALIALCDSPAWGCATAFAGHVLFLLFNSLVVSPAGAVREVPADARRSIARIDGALASLCCAAALAPSYALLPSSFVALFAIVFLYQKFVGVLSL